MSELRLITGKKGSGKTLWTVDQLFKEFEKGFFQHFYSDITGLKHTGILPAPEDWREIPNNSLIVYDEVQYKLLFSRHNSKRDTQILDLTTMRKRGIAIWIITQKARFLNADVLGLVDKHFHLERNGKKTVKVWEFNDAELNITKTKKLFAFDSYVFAYPEEVFNFYQSTEKDAKHADKSYLNKGVVTTCITLALVFIFGGYYIYKGWVQDGMTVGTTGVQDLDRQQPKDKTGTDKNKSNSPSFLVPEPDQAQDLSQTCRHGENVSKPECVKWFNDLSNSKSSINSDGVVFESVSYDSSKPYDFKPQAQIQVKDYPRVSGCARNLKGEYVAIDQQGNLMPEVSASDCKKWINGHRPFDYTRSPVQQESLQAKQQEQPQTVQKWTPEQLEQLMIAKEQGLI